MCICFSQQTGVICLVHALGLVQKWIHFADLLAIGCFYFHYQLVVTSYII